MQSCQVVKARRSDLDGWDERLGVLEFDHDGVYM